MPEITIRPEPTEEEAALIAAAVEMLLEQEAAEARSAGGASKRLSPWRSAAPWRAATRPRPASQLPKGVAPSLAWRLSGRIGKPFGR